MMVAIAPGTAVAPDRTRQLASAAYRLVNTLADGATSETTYDTAAVSALRSPRDNRKLAYPATLAWLRQRQHADGSWGGRITIAHDRLISTLAATVRLCSVAEPWARAATERGVAYLGRHATDWQRSPDETVAFELLVPHLLDEARRWELPLPYAAFDPILPLRADKLRRIPADVLYSRPTTIVHSLEFLGDDVDRQRVGKLRSKNGAFGNSPSATAYALAHVDDSASEEYLRRSMAVSLNGGACTVFPIEIFERAWVLFNLGGLARGVPGAAAHLAFLRRQLANGPIGMSCDGLAADSDDTGMALALLHRAGEAPDMGALDPFARADCYSCFPYERNTSVGANAHVLDALATAPNRECHGAAIAKVIAYLRASRLEGRYWRDKWHISPYYATMQVAVAAYDIAPDLVAASRPWLLESQRDDGSWGWFSGTAEETAYALQALLARPDPLAGAARGAVERGARYLAERFDDADYPELWIGKGLYTAYAIVQAAIIGALWQSQARLAER